MLKKMINKILQGSCFDLINKLPENSVDLIVTSPPYADVKSYGDNVNVMHPDNYVDWILPLVQSSFRALKPSGSFIINIDDKCVKKKRHTYVLDLMVRGNRETDMHLYDYYIWHKKTGIPNGSEKRLNHRTEWIMHFVKDVNQTKWNMDAVRQPNKEITIKRNKAPINIYETDSEGNKIVTGKKFQPVNPKGVIPVNVLRFNTNANRKGNIHPAPFSRELPEWFIKALTDEGDLVLDPFMGSGTTAVAARDLNRNYLGFELNQTYIDYAENRINPNPNVDTFFG